jgi:hypothetical protein
MATLYFNATISGDPSYSTVGNWWTNAGATIPAGVIPTAFDDIIVQTAMWADPNANYVGVDNATFNNNSYLDSTPDSAPHYYYALSANTATFNGNSYITLNSGISNNSVSPFQAGNAIFNGTATNRGGYVDGTAQFNYYTEIAGVITDITGYGVGVASGGPIDSNGFPIRTVNFVNTDFQSGGYMTTYQGTSSDVTINFYNSTANYGNIFGTATFYDYSQNYGNLDYVPLIVYPNPNVFVQGTYNAHTNTGAIYYGYGVYFNTYIINGNANNDFADPNNWFLDGTTPLGYVPSSPMDASAFDCSILTDSSGSASLEVFYLYGNTYLQITITAAVDFYNNSHNEGTINLYGQFSDNSYNNGTINSIDPYSTTFNNSSHNAGNVTGTSAFYGNSYNSGYVGTSGGTTASFHDASQNRGVIGGPSLTSGALAYWNFNNNGSGGVSLLDSTGNGNTLTNNGGVALGTGIIGGDAVFNANNLFISTSNFFNGDFTFSSWAKFTDTTQYAQLIGNETGSTGFTLLFNNLATGDVGVYTDNGGFEIGGGSNLNNGNWNNIVFEKLGTTLNLYINGTLINTATASGSYSGNAYYIGQNNAFTGRDYIGQLDEIGIWNRALSQAEVTALYNGGAGRTYPFTGYIPPTSNGDFNDTSINIGLVTGTARFRYVTASSGVAVDITGYANGPVNGLTYDSANNVITTWKFQGTDFMQSGATVTGNAQFTQNTGASGIPVCLITGNAVVTSPAQRPLLATVLGTVTYVGYGGSSSVNIFVMLNFPFPLNYILGKTNPVGISSLLKLPFYINK